MAQLAKTFYPYDPLPAQDLNDMVGFMNGIASGANMEPGSVTTDTLAESARQHFKIGRITNATLSSTGHKSISGLGFKPKFVKFELVSTSPANTSNIHGSGAMDEHGNQYWQGNTTGSANNHRSGGFNDCIGYVGTASTTPSLLARYVSMNSDGFTINVTVDMGGSTAFDVAYIAQG